MIHVAGWIIGLISAVVPLPAVHPALSLLGRIALIAGGSFAVAWVSWHAFESPFLSLKRYFEYEPGSPEADARADLYKRSAGRNDRSFTLGPVDGMSPGATIGEMA